MAKLYDVDNCYARFDPDKDYEMHLARDGYRIQGAETNDMQLAFLHRLKGIADALFKDGGVISAAQVVIDEQTGEIQAAGGTIYIDGAMRTIRPASFFIPTAGPATIGVYRRERTITELDDPSIKNPAVGLRGEGEAGAWRRQIRFEWGVFGDGGDGQFYPVYEVEDGVLKAKEAPPNFDLLARTLGKYDRESTGDGNYIVSGLVLRAAGSTGDGAQVYTVSEGTAHVYGLSIELPTSRRLSYDAKPDLRFRDTEVAIGDGTPSQRVTVAHAPIHSVATLRITRRFVEQVVHGAYSGAADALQNGSVVSIVECRQGETVYTANSEYKKTGDTVDWSPAGNEPAPGSTYQCTYDAIVAVEPLDRDYDGFSVENAVSGSSIIYSYNQALPRVDRLCLAQDGGFFWDKGVPAEYNPRPASATAGVLGIATVWQDWRGGPGQVDNDGVRVTSFAAMEALVDRVNFILAEIARSRLESDVATREGGARVGIFVDPLLDDSMRDQGLEQTASIVRGELLLPITAQVHGLPEPARVAVPAYTPTPILSQPLRTGSMRVNPYMSFGVLPARVTLNPAIDQFVEVDTQWTSAATRRFDVYVYAPNARDHGAVYGSSSSSIELVSSQTVDAEYLREIAVGFAIKGFGAGEILRRVIFDGVEAEFTPATANADGELSGSFTIPPRITAGAKTVTFMGGEDGGSTGSAVFIGQGKLTTKVIRDVVTTTYTHIDPLAQTFTLERNAQICGVDLWFTAKSGEVRVQLREVVNGVPGRTILAEAVLEPELIVVSGGGHTRALFDIPVQLQANSEYAVVVLCNDPDTALSVAVMGEFDANVQKWVSAQPYTVGVLLSSSNAATWTPHQDRDLTFRLLEAGFTPGTTSVAMGAADLAAATDLVVLAADERPSADALVEYTLTMPDGVVYTLDQGQPIRIQNPISGQVSIAANLKGTAQAAPLLWPGAQLLAGAISQTGSYYSRSITALDAVRAVLIYEALIPSGSGVTAEMQIDGGAWQPLTDPATAQQGDGVVEYSYAAELVEAQLIKLRLTLSGTTQARPSVRNIRFMALK